ncbi:MAG TPA: ABC transporter permease [Oscillatoriales cyanobacterium M59_W2019_021]|nr:ABC transporter permease [Oscillatoriales cyanobacterium M59_W2019_021]
MTSIARKNLLEDIPRFIVAQAGIMFAVSLVTIQTGILNGFTRSTVLLIEGSDADIWVASDKMVQFEITEPLLYEQVNRVQEVEGVERAEALFLGSGRWKPQKGETSPLKLVGFDPSGVLFNPGTLTQGNIEALKQPYTVMVDQSRLGSLESSGVGDRARVGDLPAEIVALTEGSQSIAASTFLYSSLDTANAYANAGFTSRIKCQIRPGGETQCTNIYEKLDEPPDPSIVPQTRPPVGNDPITYILVSVRSGEDLAEVQRQIEKALPGTVAKTTAQMSQMTQDYWEKRTGLGFVLGLGAAVGVVVGAIVVAQILYSSVSDHLREFGTLKAMGASDWVLYGIIVEQSLWMAVLGYIPGMLLCWGVSAWAATKGIIILISPLSAAGVFGITVVMCVGSAFFAIQKVTRIDPAMVFKA